MMIGFNLSPGYVSEISLSNVFLACSFPASHSLKKKELLIISQTLHGTGIYAYIDRHIRQSRGVSGIYFSYMIRPPVHGTVRWTRPIRNHGIPFP